MDSKQRIHVMTLANSIIGVSILAMPFCFKQCGIILSILLLLFSSVLCRLACHFLLKSAIKARLRTFEFLAYHVFGSIGKLFVEIGIIGFLLGTCVAFFVVMGDLGPQIIAQISETKSMATLRTTILIAIGLLCVLPLGLLRNVDSLSSVSIATIGFYGILAIKIFMESAPHLFTGNWYENIDFWRPAGILQCLPIFSMALFCQTQLFEIYQAIPNASLDKMNELVKIAVNICTSVYIFVGVFGYIAVSHKPTFSGNILMDFEPSIFTETMKIGFVLSVACSFPLVIFPCRASLYSLLYRPTYTGLHDSTSLYIPEGKFRLLTFVIVSISLTIGVLIPNIELVLGLVGSTIGIMICVIFPATCFICLTDRNTNERIIAQLMLFIGISVMVLGTYANLYAIDHIETSKLEKFTPNLGLQVDVNVINQNFVEMKNIDKLEDLNTNQHIDKEIQIKIPDAVKEVRHEPPQPEEEPENPKDSKLEAPVIETIKVEDKLEAKQEAPQLISPQELIKSPDKPEVNVIPMKKEETLPEPKIAKEASQESSKNDIKEAVKERLDMNDKKEPNTKQEQGLVDSEAIAKEDKELAEATGNSEHEILLAQKQELIQQQETLLKNLKKNQEQQQVQEEKLRAVKSIQNMAQKAIDFIVDDKLKDIKILSKVENNIAEMQNILESDAKTETEIVQTKKPIFSQDKNIQGAPLPYQLSLHQNKNYTLLNKNKTITNVKNGNADSKLKEGNHKTNNNFVLKNSNLNNEDVKVATEPIISKINLDKTDLTNQKEINNKLDINGLADNNLDHHEIKEIKQTLNVEILKKLPNDTEITPKKNVDDSKEDKNHKNVEENKKVNIENKIDKKKMLNKPIEINDVKKVGDNEKQSDDAKKHAENLEIRRDILSQDYDLNKSK